MERKSHKIIYFLPIIILYGTLIGGGLIKILVESSGYIPAFGMNDFSFDSYVSLFDKGFIRDLLYSLILSSIATAISLIVGTGFAYKLTKSRNVYIKKIVSSIMNLGMIVPYLYMVFITILLFGQTGIYSRIFYHLGVIDDLSSFPILLYSKYGIGILLTYIAKGIPFVCLFVLNLMEQISDDYDQVAKSLGASDLVILFKVYLPQCANMLVWASMILFAFDFGSFEVPYILGTNEPRMLAVRLYSRYISPGIDKIPEAMAMAIVLFILGFIAVLLYAVIVRKSINLLAKIASYLPDFSSKTDKINKKIAPIFLLIFTLIPLIYLLLLSFNNYFRYPLLFPSGATSEYWVDTLTDNPLFIRSILGSILIGSVTAIISTAIGFFTARGVVLNYNNRSHQAIMLLSLPVFIPSMALFIGVHQILLQTPFSNHWTGIVLAHTLICLPYTCNIGIAYFRGIPRDLEAVSQSLGANWFYNFFGLLLPMLRSGLALSLTIAFLISNTEYFSTFLIGGGNTVTLSMVIYPYVTNANYTMSSITAVVFLVIQLSLFIFINRLFKHKNTFKALYGLE